MTDYSVMCQTSPVQKEWKPKQCDIYSGITNSHEELFYVGQCTLKVINEYWLPRQEDWQEIGSEYFTRVRRSCNMWRDFKDFCSIPGCIPSCIKDGKFSERLTIIWCLFVHKEVYKLVWDWEEKKWKKA